MPNLYQTAVFHAERRPGAIAVEDDAGELDFGAFARLAADHAGRLATLGVCKGDRVCVLMDTCRDYVALYYATAVTGFVLVPVNVRLAARELAWMLDDAEPSVLIVGPGFTELAHAALATAQCATRVHHTTLDAFRDVSISRRITPDTAHSTAPDAMTLRYGCVEDNDIALMIYTSGTTSRPKGAMLTHGNLAWNAINQQIELGLDEHCSAILATPLFHIAGLGVLNGPILYGGGGLCIVPRFDADTLIATLQRRQPTHLFLLSAMWVTLTATPSFATLRFPGVRYVQTAAAPLAEHRQAAIRRVFPEAEFGWGFGMTETSPTTIKNRYTAEILAHPGSIGYLWRHVQGRVVAEDGRVWPPCAAEGELQVKGPTVFAGYWRNPQATAATFTADGWLRTGDLLRFDGEGYAWFLGRLKDMIKTGGENVAAIEVELCLIEHVGVLEAAVYGVAHERWGEAVHAAVVLREGGHEVGQATPSALQAFCRARLAGFKVPKRITVLGELPKSSSGKVQKFKLQALETQETR